MTLDLGRQSEREWGRENIASEKTFGTAAGNILQGRREQKPKTRCSKLFRCEGYKNIFSKKFLKIALQNYFPICIVKLLAVSQNNNKGTQTRQAEELLSIHRRSPEAAALNKQPLPTAVKSTPAEKNPLGPHSYPTCIFQESKQVSHSSEVANRDFQFPVRAMQEQKWDVGLVSSPSPHPTASKPTGSFPATLQGQHCP